MRDLFDSDGESANQNNNDILTINHEFKRKYDEKKKKEALSRAKELLKNNRDDELLFTDSSSSSEDEDSEAELLDFQTQNKILDTLNMIKKKDPSIYNSSHVIFSDSDSDNSEGLGDHKKEKPLTYKDYERKLFLNNLKDVNNDQLDKKKPNKLLYDKEQEDLRRAFLEASVDLEKSDDESETFVKKIKTEEELKNEENTFKSFLLKNTENGIDPMESLNRYWGPEEELDENEKFLRNYILNQEWKEVKGQSRINNENSYNLKLELDEIDEDEDEKHLEMSNEFESVYNFRYEEPNIGQQIQSYSRNITSLRKPDDRRKNKRKEKKERKAEEKLRLQEELKMLKSWKKKEIIEKLKKIQKVSGNNKITEENIDLESEFDSEKHDKCMKELFGQEYDEQKEPLSISEILREDEDEKSEYDCLGNKKKSLNKNEDKKNEYNDNFEWWQCDGCFKEIVPNKKKFDCAICENYTLCKSCYKNTDHEHPLKKSRVPDYSFVENAITFKYGDDERVNSLLDEYYGLDFEDVLDNGKLPVRFKYTKVEKNDYGLKTEDILTMNDKDLNKHISLKKLAPYRIDKKKYKKNNDKVLKSLNKKKLNCNLNNTRVNTHINKNRLQAYC